MNYQTKPSGGESLNDIERTMVSKINSEKSQKHIQTLARFALDFADKNSVARMKKHLKPQKMKQL
jgi:hypothetical protein